MSSGIKPQDFVQQVYYTQEKVILDFWPSDDKYKEIIMEANLALQELQKEEDWNWLREPVRLGVTHDRGINVFSWDTEEYYKPATMYQDCVKLCAIDHNKKVLKDNFISVPIVSHGSLNVHDIDEYNSILYANTIDMGLKCAFIGDQLKFNRRFTPHEQGRAVVVDMIQRLKPLHICNDDCRDKDNHVPDYDPQGGIHPCAQIEDKVFEQIPDPLYMITRVAARHAEASPSAQFRVQSLQDQAQKMLSAMRKANAAATDSDYIEWEVPGFIDMI